MKILLPKGWTPPIGYSNGIEASGRLVFVAGQVGWNAAQVFESEDLAAQFSQALRNILAVLAEAVFAATCIARRFDERVHTSHGSSQG